MSYEFSYWDSFKNNRNAEQTGGCVSCSRADNYLTLVPNVKLHQVHILQFTLVDDVHSEEDIVTSRMSSLTTVYCPQ